MNLQESIRRILRESLESEWNEGNYDYQHGFCHYFAYNIIDKIRERFPNKKVNYYLLLANEVNKDTDEVEQDYLLHVYIKIGDKLLDSNGFTTMDEVEQRVGDWYNKQLTMTPEEYDINVWEEESDEIPEMFFNNQFCNTKRVKEDMEKFLSHPSVQKLLKDTLNESKSSNRLNIINDLVEPFKNEDCVCDIDVWYDEEDDMYSVYLVFGSEELNDNFTSDGKIGYVRKKQKEVKETIQSYLPIKNIYVGSYSKPNCGWSPLNESEDDKEKKIEKNLKIIRKYLDIIDWDGLCKMWVEYNPQDGDYEIRSKAITQYNDQEIINELGILEFTIRSWGLKTYVFAPYYVENCEDEIEYLNESENKKSGLLRAIEQDGLFQVMQDTGLSMGQIILKYDNLPREVFERYIKDFIKHDGYHQTDGSVQLGYEVEIQTHVYIEHFYMKGDRVTVEIRRFDNRGHQTEGYIESMLNLTDEEIFNIVDDMTSWSNQNDL